MSLTPFFSIVVPVYNVDSYLKLSLEDLQSQTFTDWEAIIVDDASPDNSKNIAQTFINKDSRFKIVSHKTNQGLSSARNTGIKNARGKYIWFPDPDDRYKHNLLEAVKNAIEEQSSPIILFGHSEIYFNQKGSIDKKKEFKTPSATLNQQSLRKNVMQLEVNTQYGYAWNKFYSIDYIKKHHLAFENELPLIEDISFNIKAFQDLTQLTIIEDNLYLYSKREANNLTNKYVPNYYQLHRQRIEMLRNQQLNWGLLDDEVKGILGMLFARYILSTLERNCSKQSQMGHKERTIWCKRAFEDPLFNDLVMKAQSSSATLSFCIKALQTKNAQCWTLLGRLIHLAKESPLHNAFLLIKSKR